jgi:acyl-CoA thioesterase
MVAPDDHSGAMSEPFLDLRATHNPHRWFLPLTDKVCVGPPGAKFMFGGVGLGASIAALERTCGRPVIWATAQYLSFARPPSVVDLDVWTPVQGRHNTQARVIGHVDDKEILTVNAALGSRTSEISRQWLNAPSVPGPKDCPIATHWRGEGDDLHSHLEMRIAHGRWGWSEAAEPSADGRLVIWLRPKADLPIDAPMLAIMADHVPSGIGNALGLSGGGNSLDNTIRFVRMIPTEWVLCEVRISGIHGGFAHGSMYLFAETGELIAVASQSMIVRVRE